MSSLSAPRHKPEADPLQLHRNLISITCCSRFVQYIMNPLHRQNSRLNNNMWHNCLLIKVQMEQLGDLAATHSHLSFSSTKAVFTTVWSTQSTLLMKSLCVVSHQSARLTPHTSLVVKWCRRCYETVTDVCKREATWSANEGQPCLRGRNRARVRVNVSGRRGVLAVARPDVTCVLSEPASKQQININTSAKRETHTSGPHAVDTGGVIKRTMW